MCVFVVGGSSKNMFQGVYFIRCWPVQISHLKSSEGSQPLVLAAVQPGRIRLTIVDFGGCPSSFRYIVALQCFTMLHPYSAQCLFFVGSSISPLQTARLLVAYIENQDPAHRTTIC